VSTASVAASKRDVNERQRLLIALERLRRVGAQLLAGEPIDGKDAAEIGRRLTAFLAAAGDITHEDAMGIG
jgi:hypothetical protein